MNNNLTIYDELKELSGLIAGIPPVNVYAVPDGYFENLAADALLRVSREEKAGLTDLQNAVPAGYFDGLANSIMDRIKSENNAIAGEEEHRFLGGIKPINVYSTPAGYFESLPGRVLQRIQAAEGNVLESVRKINVYSVPDGYFESLPEVVMSQLARPAKVVGFSQRTVVFKYAIAAAITGILGFSLFTVFNQKVATDPSSAASMAVVAEGNRILKSGNFENELQAITDDEIVTFLESNGQDVNAALVASVTDEKTLPAEDEYLFDDNTLDNFLSELNLSQNNSTSN